MFSGFALFLWSVIELYVWLILTLFRHGPIGAVRNVVLATVILPLFIGLQLSHWLGFLIDAVLFPSYRRISIDKPIFLTGVPRSGTTFLQRTLAKDKRFTTVTLWEALLAPSISERYLFKLLGWIFRPLKSVSKLFRWSFFKKMNSIHELGLTEAEEDFLLLLPIFSCFIQMVLFPQYPTVWKLAFFDLEVGSVKKKIILNFYRRLIQKHLYFHGSDFRYLSKNPSFTSMIESLIEEFPDAHFIGCYRSPTETVPSQFSSLQPAFDLLKQDIQESPFKQNIIQMLHHYYQILGQQRRSNEQRLLLVEMSQLKEDLFTVIRDLYHRFDMEFDPDLQIYIENLAGQSRHYSSEHKYKLSDFGLDKQQIEEQFQDVWPFSNKVQADQRQRDKSA